MINVVTGLNIQTFLIATNDTAKSKKLYLRFCMIIFSLPSKDMFQLYGPFKRCIKNTYFDLYRKILHKV